MIPPTRMTKSNRYRLVISVINYFLLVRKSTIQRESLSKGKIINFCFLKVWCFKDRINIKKKGKIEQIEISERKFLSYQCNEFRIRIYNLKFILIVDYSIDQVTSNIYHNQQMKLFKLSKYILQLLLHYKIESWQQWFFFYYFPRSILGPLPLHL